MGLFGWAPPDSRTVEVLWWSQVKLRMGSSRGSSGDAGGARAICAKATGMHSALQVLGGGAGAMLSATKQAL